MRKILKSREHLESIVGKLNLNRFRWNSHMIVEFSDSTPTFVFSIVPYQVMYRNDEDLEKALLENILSFWEKENIPPIPQHLNN